MQEDLDFLIQAYPQIIDSKELQEFIARCKYCQAIAHNNAISALVYEVLSSNNETDILKIPYNNLRFKREVFCLNTLQNILPVAKVVQEFAAIDNFPGAILMTKIPGKPLKEEELTTELAFIMGEYLAKLHEVKVDDYYDFARPNEEISSPLAVLMTYFQESLMECKSIVDPKLLEKSEQIFQQLQPELKDFEGPKIVHRDYRPGNVLADQKQIIIGIIDFENAQASFAQDDFARMDTLVWHKYPMLMAPFLQGYSNIRSLPNLDFLPLLKMCKLLGAIGFTAARGTWNGKHAHIYKDNMEVLVEVVKEF